MSEPAFKLQKVFDCQKMPDALRKKFFAVWDTKSNDSCITCCPGEEVDSGGDSKEVGEWLIANGADEDEEVLVLYWW